ncbi:hypothetical protein AC249_AIPGENE2985, partial [Exaiptasia diaphana]
GTSGFLSLSGSPFKVGCQGDQLDRSSKEHR